ncbi:MAG: hypothetical protein JWN25_3026, partial [Verrucomicrobiales bacterium]|nr:hypothetical protein [Verrucomicrobiales bacterium]
QNLSVLRESNQLCQFGSGVVSWIELVD